MYLKNFLTNKYFWLLIFFGAYLRLVDYTKDPFYISSSRAVFVDSGIYTFNAKLYNQTGNFNFDDKEYNYHFIFPIYSGISALIFKIFGVNYDKFIIINAIAGIIGAIFLAATANTLKTQLITLFFYMFYFVLIAFNRSGLMENFVFLWLAIVLFLYNTNKKLWLVLSGILSVLGIFLKTNLIVILIALIIHRLISDLFYIKNEENIIEIKSEKHRFAFWLGIILGFAISIFFIYYNRDFYKTVNSTIIFRQIFSEHLETNNLFAFFRRFITFFDSNLFVRELPLYLLTLYIIFFKINFRKIEEQQLLLILIMLLNYFFVLLSDYSPLRYRIFFIAVLPLFCANYLCSEKPLNFINISFKSVNIKIMILKILCFIFLAALPLSMYFLNDIAKNHSEILGVSNDLILKNRYILSFFSSCLISLVFLFIIFYFSFLFRKNVFIAAISAFIFVVLDFIFKSKIKIIIFSLFFFIVAMNQYYKTFKRTNYDLRKNCEFVNSLIPKNSIINGWWAPQLLFNRLEVKIIPGKPYPEFIKKYSVDFIIADKNEKTYISETEFSVIANLKFQTIKTELFVLKKNNSNF